MSSGTRYWPEVLLSDVVGQRIEKATPTDGDTRPYLALEHLQQGRPKILGWYAAGTATSAKTVFRQGDVLFGKLRPNLRKAAAAPFAGVCSTDILALFAGDRLDARYLLQLVHWKPLQRHAVATSSGTKMPRTSWKNLGEFKFCLPPVSEQRKIAAILSSVDTAIEKTQEVIDQVQIVKRGLMQELLSRGLPGRHRNFKQTEIGKIPEPWSVRTLAAVCTHKGQYGANVAKRLLEPGGIRYIRITDIEIDGMLRDEAVGISEEDAEGYLLCLGDILLARSGATVGKSYLHRDSDLRSAFAGYLIRFKTNHQIIMPPFLKEYLDTATYWRWVANRQRAQAQPNINASEYGQLPVPCPHLEEQRRIIDIAESFNSSLLSEKSEISAKHRLKQALLAALLSGQVRVTRNCKES